MAQAYQEVIEGETYMRAGPGARHELICRRLHTYVSTSLQGNPVARLLEPRTVIQISPGTFVRPDLVVLAVPTGKPWLVAEVVDSEDHRTDTVLKKGLYEEMNIPRLWMVDPRYDNLEVYHGTRYGLMLKGILCVKETLVEELLPEFRLTIGELFSG